MHAKTLSIVIFAFALLTLTSQAALYLTGIFDGPLSGGTPKGIELYASDNIADLSAYAVGTANNGGGSDGAEFILSGSASSGDYIYVVANGNEDEFTSFLGGSATFASSALGINGDDAIELFHYEVSEGGDINETVVDTFGDINVNGDGEDWDYTDGWAYRNTVTAGGAFTTSDWTFSGLNAWDGATSNASSGSVMPIGTFTTTPVPEPSTYALLVGLVGLSYTLNRRRRA
jgi:hypothetical protein